MSQDLQNFQVASAKIREAFLQRKAAAGVQ